MNNQNYPNNGQNLPLNQTPNQNFNQNQNSVFSPAQANQFNSPQNQFPNQNQISQPVAFPSQPIQNQPVITQPVQNNQPTANQTQKNTNQSQNSNPSNPNSTQNSIQIAEIRDSVVILKDSTFRAVITCQSINFDLMSSREREGVEYAYQNFLNSLYFPIQISIRSQRVDIAPYIEKLTKIRANQDNMLLNYLIDDYINYIDILSQEANIMEKSFFIVVPYMPAGDVESAKKQMQGIFSKINNKPTTNIKVNQQVFTKAKEEIDKRVSSILSGLEQVGVRAERLNTQKLSQLYYDFYNPDTALRQPLISFDKMSTLYTRKGHGEAPRLNMSGDLQNDF